MKKVRWGILGPGIIAQQFAHDFQYANNAELVAVASRSLQRGQEFADQYGIPTVYDNYDALYGAADIDVIYIATPHVFHFEQSKKALESGKAVLCEKPITVNPEECQELIDIARKEQVYLMEGMWTYFLPVVREAKKWVTEGRIGKVLHVKSDFGYPKEFDPSSRLFDPTLAGGSLLDMGVYTIAMDWLFHHRESDQKRVVVHKAPNGVDIDTHMVFQYSDAMSTLHSAFSCKLHNWTYVIGEKGYIAIPDFWRAKEAFLYEEENIIDTVKDTRQSFGFDYEIESVSEDLIQGRKESGIMPHAYSQRLQNTMAQVINQF